MNKEKEEHKREKLEHDKQLGLNCEELQEEKNQWLMSKNLRNN